MSEPRIRVLNLGAGVQSTAFAYKWRAPERRVYNWTRDPERCVIVDSEIVVIGDAESSSRITPIMGMPIKGIGGESMGENGMKPEVANLAHQANDLLDMVNTKWAQGPVVDAARNLAGGMQALETELAGIINGIQQVNAMLEKATVPEDPTVRQNRACLTVCKAEEALERLSRVKAVLLEFNPHSWPVPKSAEEVRKELEAAQHEGVLQACGECGAKDLGELKLLTDIAHEVIAKRGAAKQRDCAMIAAREATDEERLHALQQDRLVKQYRPARDRARPGYPVDRAYE